MDQEKVDERLDRMNEIITHFLALSVQERWAYGLFAVWAALNAGYYGWRVARYVSRRRKTRTTELLAETQINLQMRRVARLEGQVARLSEDLEVVTQDATGRRAEVDHLRSLLGAVEWPEELQGLSLLEILLGIWRRVPSGEGAARASAVRRINARLCQAEEELKQRATLPESKNSEYFDRRLKDLAKRCEEMVSTKAESRDLERLARHLMGAGESKGEEPDDDAERDVVRTWPSSAEGYSDLAEAFGPNRAARTNSAYSYLLTYPLPEVERWLESEGSAAFRERWAPVVVSEVAGYTRVDLGPGMMT